MERERENSFGTTNHGKAVADPKTTPTAWTEWYVNGLTVNSYDVCWDVADGTAADERRDVVAGHGHHRQRSSC